MQIDSKFKASSVETTGSASRYRAPKATATLCKRDKKTWEVVLI